MSQETIDALAHNNPLYGYRVIIAGGRYFNDVMNC